MAHDRWLLIDGKYYYFYSSGSMATDTTAVGGVQGLDVSGQWIPVKGIWIFYRCKAASFNLPPLLIGNIARKQ